MKQRITYLQATLCVLAVAAPCLAQKPAPEEAISRLSRSADGELGKSIKELNGLREKIAAEKVPLAQQLTADEEKLAELRREYEKVSRLVDSGNLEIVTIKAEAKAKQDELAYIANLLDEYARTFETKINVSEMQYCGEALTAAKQATENSTLSLGEKLTKQLAFTDVSLQRLSDAIGGMRFPGVGVDMQGNVREGQFAIIGPVALFQAKADAASGLAIPQSGSPNPLIRPLEGELQGRIGPLVRDGEGTLPLDPSRGGAIKAIVQKTDIKHIFKKGGPIMWPLLVAAVLAVLTVFHRVLFLLLEGIRRSPRAMDAFFAAVTKGENERAIAISRKSKFYVLRALGYALENRENSLESALLYATERELKRFRRGIPVLDTVITLAPLLGLLGTVTGMMGSFALIGGELSAPGAITGGIAEALIATAFGLGIAITSLIPFNYLNTKLEEARIEIETAGTQLELLANTASRAVESEAQGQPALAAH